MSEFIVRAATPADEVAVAAVNASAIETLRQVYRPNARAVAQKSAQAHTLTRLVAERAGRIVGAVDYRLESDRLHFLSLDVHADSRRQGVARFMIAELDRIGRQAGLERLTTYTVVQTGNVAIFERLGFRVASIEPSELFESDRFDAITEAFLERPIGK